MIKIAFFLSSVLTVSYALPVFAHTRLSASAQIQPRSTSDAIKGMAYSCGTNPRPTTFPTLTAGATIPISWRETVQHTGRFEIWFSTAGDMNWQLLKTVPDDQNVGGVAHDFSTTVTLPNTPCTACTLLLIQVMQDTPTSTSNYYSCADMKLEAAVTATPTPSPSPTSTPTVVTPVCTPLPQNR